MKVFYLALAAGVAFTAHSLKLEPVDAATPEPGPTGVYSVWLTGADTGCKLAIGLLKAGESVRIARSGDCSALDSAAPGIETAAMQHDGQMLLEDGKGRTLAELAVSEGFAYEVAAPAALMMALAED